MNVIKNLVPESKYYLKCPHSMTPTRIVVHNTANDASARNEIAYMIRNDNETSFHYAVDDKEVVQGIPENRNAWHASDGNGPGNREGIAIEICYSLSGGDRFTKAEENAVLLIVDILKRYGWGVEKVTKHQDYGNKKYCPHRTLDLGWDRFIKMIEIELEKQKEMYTLLLNVPVYISSKDALSKTNPVKTYEPGEYYVFNRSNGMVNITKTPGKAGGWINPEDNKVDNKVDNKEESSVNNEESQVESGSNIEDDSYYENIEKNNPLLWLIDALIHIFETFKRLFK